MSLCLLFLFHFEWRVLLIVRLFQQLFDLLDLFLEFIIYYVLVGFHLVRLSNYVVEFSFATTAHDSQRIGTALLDVAHGARL